MQARHSGSGETDDHLPVATMHGYASADGFLRGAIFTRGRKIKESM